MNLDLDRIEPSRWVARLRLSLAIRDLGSLAAFQAHFDADSAHPRLVLLLSPT